MYSSTNIGVIISRRIRWAGHVECRGQDRCIQGFGGET